MTPTIGRYQILRPLGAGGMATVYLAHDPTLDRQVAIKMPNVERLSAEGLARFNVEARAVARLEHQAIVPLYDYGDHDGRPYLVMRYLPGGSLADRLERRAFNLNEALGIIERIAAALDYAHSQGILHRDVKPGNILFDESGAAYLTDFGIDRITGLVFGTVAYMSPEQALGRTVDGRADLYSLGIVLYEMLTGDIPYKSESQLQQAMQHVNAPIPDIRTQRPDLPPAVQQVIARALAKKPEERYRTAGEMAAESRRIVGRYSAAMAPAYPAPTTGPSLVWIVKWLIIGLALFMQALVLSELLSRNSTTSQDATATSIAAAGDILVVASQTAAAAIAMTTTAEALAPTSTPLPPTETPPSTATPQSPPSDLIAVVNLTQQVQSDGTVISSAELIYQSLGLGKMEVIAPEVMTLGRSDTVTLRIVPGSVLPGGQPITIYPDDSDEVEPTPRVNSPIEIYPLMTATMLGGGGYRIDSTSSDTQPILSDAPTVWTWLVTPQEPGEHQLLLIITVPVRVSGTAGIISTKEIRVDLDIQIVRGIAFWLTWAGVLFIIIALLYSLYRFIVLPRWIEAQYASDKALVVLVDGLDLLDEEEAKDLAFRMGYEYGDLDVGNKRTKLRSLVIKCARRKEIDELVRQARIINDSAEFLPNYSAITKAEYGKHEETSS